MMDGVNSPHHYRRGNIETIEFIRSTMSPDAYKGYLRGNVLKYLSRYDLKDGIKDLEKAKVYLDWLIKEEEHGR